MVFLVFFTVMFYNKKSEIILNVGCAQCSAAPIAGIGGMKL
ncbi:hypothetical protein IMSAGC015_00745 [Lachnospiraceae bacterium]|nr:hypothetical protein IMSAGC015_00745 [Lachnospiraceae bacterium]